MRVWHSASIIDNGPVVNLCRAFNGEVVDTVVLRKDKLSSLQAFPHQAPAAPGIIPVKSY